MVWEEVIMMGVGWMGGQKGPGGIRVCRRIGGMIRGTGGQAMSVGAISGIRNAGSINKGNGGQAVSAGVEWGQVAAKEGLGAGGICVELLESGGVSRIKRLGGKNQGLFLAPDIP